MKSPSADYIFYLHLSEDDEERQGHICGEIKSVGSPRFKIANQSQLLIKVLVWTMTMSYSVPNWVPVSTIPHHRCSYSVPVCHKFPSALVPPIPFGRVIPQTIKNPYSFLVLYPFCTCSSNAWGTRLLCLGLSHRILLRSDVFLCWILSCIQMEPTIK